MSRVIRTPFKPILLALKARVALVTGIDISRVNITLLDANEAPHYDALQDILLRPSSERPADGAAEIDGGLRYDNRRQRDVKVIIRTRLNLDPAGFDEARLTTGDESESLGHLALEDATAEALEGFIVTDEDDNILTTQCRLGNLDGPERASGKGKESGWCHSSWNLMTEYERYFKELDN